MMKYEELFERIKGFAEKEDRIEAMVMFSKEAQETAVLLKHAYPKKI